MEESNNMEKEVKITIEYPEQNLSRSKKVKIPIYDQLFELVGELYSPSISYFVTLNYLDEDDEFIILCNQEEWLTYLELTELEDPDFKEITVYLREIDQEAAATWEESEIGRKKMNFSGMRKNNKTKGNKINLFEQAFPDKKEKRTSSLPKWKPKKEKEVQKKKNDLKFKKKTVAMKLPEQNTRNSDITCSKCKISITHGPRFHSLHHKEMIICKKCHDSLEYEHFMLRIPSGKKIGEKKMQKIIELINAPEIQETKEDIKKEEKNPFEEIKDEDVEVEETPMFHTNGKKLNSGKKQKMCRRNTYHHPKQIFRKVAHTVSKTAQESFQVASNFIKTGVEGAGNVISNVNPFGGQEQRRTGAQRAVPARNNNLVVNPNVLETFYELFPKADKGDLNMFLHTHVHLLNGDQTTLMALAYGRFGNPESN